MDETLIHAMIHEPGETDKIGDHDFTFTLQDDENIQGMLVSVKERPYWMETLTHLS
jgi:hypothetical protein